MDGRGLKMKKNVFIQAEVVFNAGVDFYLGKVAKTRTQSVL